MAPRVRNAPVCSSVRRFAALAAIAMLLAAGWAAAVAPPPTAAVTTVANFGLPPTVIAAASRITAIKLSCKRANNLPEGQTLARKATIKVGTVLKITLCEYGSDGGYEWMAPRYDANSLALLGTKFLPPSGPPGSSAARSGASGRSALHRPRSPLRIGECGSQGTRS